MNSKCALSLQQQHQRGIHTSTHNRSMDGGMDWWCGVVWLKQYRQWNPSQVQSE